MDSSMIALLGLVLGLIGAIVGSFAYLMGEIRKVGARAQVHLDNTRDYLTSRIEAFARTESQERATLRSEFVQSTGRVEADLRRLSEAVVRRQDIDALETRQGRSIERLEQKFDTLLTRGRNPPLGNSN
jgi:hypothetical protein